MRQGSGVIGTETTLDSPEGDAPAEKITRLPCQAAGYIHIHCSSNLIFAAPARTGSPPETGATHQSNDLALVQRGCRLRFQDEAPLAVGICDLVGWKHLERHITVQAQVTGLVDDAHASLAELLHHLVVV